MFLKVRHRRQSFDYDCGLAVAVMVSSWFKVRRPTDSDLCTGIFGTSPRSIIDYFSDKLYYRSGRFSVPRLDRCIRRGCPTVCLIQADCGVGHYVLVCGSDKDWLYYHDPARGLKKSRRRDFLNSWYDMDHRRYYNQFGIAFSDRRNRIPV